jgi:ATP-dependent DNA helicase RecQ
LSATTNIHDILKKFWGYTQFRPLQEEIIVSALAGKDTLALLPTGGGKSICFQVPGLALGGTTLVVSPLVALMNDQVQNLRKKGISAVALTSAMNFREIDIALNNAALGHVQFLYVSPERLQNENFRQKISHLPISLIAVDEAHCISQWGYDFRPSYLLVAELRIYFPNVCILALTASATKFVVEDIQAKLQFKNGQVFRQSFARNNLRYIVQLEENKIQRLLKLMRNVGGSGLVYVRNRKRTEELAQFLSKNGIVSLAYHAGLKYDDRQNIQEKWINNKVQVICATNAFGMGIDKPDVRFVVHLDLPESLEAYFQEAGRGGRDGKISYSTIFYTKADQQRLQKNFELSFPPLQDIKQIYQAVCNYYQVAIGAGAGINVDFDIERICRSYNLSPTKVYNSIRFLEKENYLTLLEGGIEPSKVMFLGGKHEVYDFELKFPRFEPLIKTLLRSYGGLYESFVAISEKELAYRVKNSAANVIDQLQQLHTQGLLIYEPQSELPKLVFVQDRINIKFLEFDPNNYILLKKRAEERLSAVLAYTDNNDICRQVQLLMYFNEYNYADCGHCDVCISKRPKDYRSIREELLLLFQEQSYTLEQLKEELMHHTDESWLHVFNEMIDEGSLYINGTVYSLAPKLITKKK